MKMFDAGKTRMIGLPYECPQRIVCAADARSVCDSYILVKIVFGHNSVADCPISVKFCARKQFFFHRIAAMGQIPLFRRTYIDIANLSVRPSVCLSVTFQYQMKTA